MASSSADGYVCEPAMATDGRCSSRSCLVSGGGRCLYCSCPPPPPPRLVVPPPPPPPPLPWHFKPPPPPGARRTTADFVPPPPPGARRTTAESPLCRTSSAPPRDPEVSLHQPVPLGPAVALAPTNITVQHSFVHMNLHHDWLNKPHQMHVDINKARMVRVNGGPWHEIVPACSRGPARLQQHAHPEGLRTHAQRSP
jgi:hypothetical protein